MSERFGLVIVDLCRSTGKKNGDLVADGLHKCVLMVIPAVADLEIILVRGRSRKLYTNLKIYGG